MFAWWLTGLILCWLIGGGILYAIAKEDKTFLVKHLIGGIAIVFVVGLIPIVSLLASAFGILMVIVVFFSDEDKNAWWNQPAYKQDETKK